MKTVSTAGEDTESDLRKIRFWEGLEADVDLAAVASRAIPVKGISHERPTLFLDVFSDLDGRLSFYSGEQSTNTNLDLRGWTWLQIESVFLPRLDGKPVKIVEGSPQPPFAWREASVSQLCTSFTYNTNAFYRILTGLQRNGRLESRAVLPLLDQACLVLAQVYRARNSFLLRNLNNNFNMYLISRVTEYLVGSSLYDIDNQEPEETKESLALALSLVKASRALPVMEKMALAIGRGVSFLGSLLRSATIKAVAQQADDASYRYFGRGLAIDHRKQLIDSIEEAARGGKFTLAVILDDTAESVEDLAWIMELMQLFPHFSAHLLVNSAQISVNFSTNMLQDVLRNPSFKELRNRLGTQFTVTEVYCPFISFQTGYLPACAKVAIGEASAVYIKGANFFETCQIQDKDTYHGFVVYGPVSRAYTGLSDFDAVFVYLPAGVTGYQHRSPPQKIKTLIDVLRETDESGAQLSHRPQLGDA